MGKINTHGMIVDFGKHTGERWTRVPASYLRWLVNEPTENSGFKRNARIAKAELERRGTTISHEVEITPHSIDTASMRVRKTWHQTKNKGEGLYTWLSRIAQEAVESTESRRDRIEYLGMTLVFKWGNEFPILKTVMPIKDQDE